MTTNHSLSTARKSICGVLRQHKSVFKWLIHRFQVKDSKLTSVHRDDQCNQVTPPTPTPTPTEMSFAVTLTDPLSYSEVIAFKPGWCSLLSVTHFKEHIGISEHDPSLHISENIFCNLISELAIRLKLITKCYLLVFLNNRLWYHIVVYTTNI